VLQSAKEEVTHVVVCWRDEWVAVGVLLADAYVLDGEELFVVAVEENGRC
jgi:hypothetical protein